MKRFNEEAVEYSMDKVAPKIIQTAEEDPQFIVDVQYSSVDSLLKVAALCRQCGIIDCTSSEEDVVAALSLAFSQVIDDYSGVIHEEVCAKPSMSFVEGR